MSAKQLLLPFRPVINLRGGLEAGAVLDVYLAGTNTRATIYSDAALTLPLSNPLTADGFGIFPTVYYNNSIPIRVVVKEANNTVVADQDPYLGDSLPSNSLGFIQSGANANSETVQDALRREVWADQYKLAADTDDSACIIRAVDAMRAANGGGIVRLSRRSYVLNNGITFSGINNVRIVGAGKSNDGTMIRETFTSGDAITFSNCQSCELSDVYFWPTVRKTSGYSVKITGGSFACRVDVRSDFGWNALLIDGATESRWKLISRYMLGSVGTLFTGTSGSRSFRAICEDQISDNPYPIAPVPSQVKTFTGGMTLVAGNIFSANGAIWQCTVGGTAGASAPSGYPSGTSPESVFTGTVTSGSATLKWVSNLSLSHLVMDNYAYSLVISKAALLNGGRSFVQQDTANTGSSYPVWVDACNLESDHAFSVGIDLTRGEGFYGHGFVWVGSCLSGNGVTIGPNYRGDVSLGTGTRVYGNAFHGILRQAGPTNVRFTGVQSADNSVISSGVYHGLTIANSASDTTINGGHYGDSVSVAGNNQGFGISIGNSTTNTSIIGTNLRGNTTGAVSIGTGQTGLLIKDCPGYNASTSTTITVTASPFTWNNTTGADALVSVGGGTVSDVSMDGVSLATATGRQFVVPAGASLVVTYSSAPTMARRLL